MKEYHFGVVAYFDEDTSTWEFEAGPINGDDSPFAEMSWGEVYDQDQGDVADPGLGVRDHGLRRPGRGSELRPAHRSHRDRQLSSQGGAMKKSPCPGVFLVPDTDGSQRTVVHFEWATISFQMYEDEALRLAREIHDILEVPPE